MDKSNIKSLEGEKKLFKISSLLILIGFVTTVCLVFFFTVFFRNRSNSAEAKIFSAQQLGATDTSVLIAWSGSEAATEFTVICSGADGSEAARCSTNQPFAAIHGLAPYQDYRVTIIPIDRNGEHDPYELKCSTSPYCTVTQIKIDEVDGSSAAVTWNYEGMDTGFTVVAYALDSEGKRHFTSQPVSVPAGAEKLCRLKNLFSELNYTVCIMPNTRYAKVGKLAFTTLKNSKKYKDLDIIRFVVCEPRATNSILVPVTNQLAPSSLYKTSMIVNAQKREEYDNAVLTLYVTDQNNRLISEYVTQNIIKKQVSADQINYRPLMTEFTSPDREGSYKIHAAFDSVTVDCSSFKVVK